jgi:hypothetical protein
MAVNYDREASHWHPKKCFFNIVQFSLTTLELISTLNFNTNCFIFFSSLTMVVVVAAVVVDVAVAVVVVVDDVVILRSTAHMT